MWVLTAAAMGLVFLWRWRRSGQTLWAFLVVRTAHLYASLMHRWRPLGTYRPPLHGAAILYANHTASPDSTFLQAGCGRRVHFLIAKNFYRKGFMTWFFQALEGVPVDRSGQDVRAARLSLRFLGQGRLLGVFPEGNLNNAGRAGLGLVRPGVAWLALRSRAPVYPAWISGGPQTYDLAPAWLRPSRKPVRVRFGAPVDLSAYYGRRITRPVLEEVTQLLMDQLVALAPKHSQPSLQRGG